MCYRIKQLFWALTAKVTEEERDFYKTYLSLKEIVLFEKLKVYDQKHSLRVAYLLKEKLGINEEMMRLGLLHDIGKIVTPLNPIEKGIMVLGDHLSHGQMKKFDKNLKIKSYYKHGEIGYELLKQEGNYEEDFLTIIKVHHVQDSVLYHQDKRLILLQEADNKA